MIAPLRIILGVVTWKEKKIFCGGERRGQRCLAADLPETRFACGRSSPLRGADATPREWLHETAVACRVIYDGSGFYDGTYGKQFVTDTTCCPEKCQLILASYRLAAVLNDLFG